MNELKVIITVVGLATAILAVALLLPSGKATVPQQYPWDIETIPGGATRVFGLQLGSSTLPEAEKFFQGEATVTLFQKLGEPLSLEAYFDKVELGGLSAKIIVVLDIGQQRLAAMMHRGTRISSRSGGGKKITLSATDLARVRAYPIAGITYHPAVQLTKTHIHRRFGEPAQIIRDPRDHSEHWLYPGRGLDIVLNPQGGEVLQYVHPAAFARLKSPLPDHGVSSRPVENRP